MKIWQIVIVILLLALFGWVGFGLYRDRAVFSRDLTELSEKVTALRSENESLSERIEYFRHPENLLKELKSQFNYRAEGEKLIILVPGIGNATGTATSTQ